MTYVINSWGPKINYDSAAALMDDDIREDLAQELAPCTEQEFFSAYAAAHAAKYGEEWILDTYNPTY